MGCCVCLRRQNFLDCDLFQDSHIVQLFFKDARQQSAIVEEIETPKVQKNFYLFDSGNAKRDQFFGSIKDSNLSWQAHLFHLLLLKSTMNSLGKC